MESTGASITLFTIITTLYIILKQTMGYTYDPKGLNDGSKQRNILLGIYITAVVVTQYMFNMRLTQSICGQVQSGSAFMMTLIPNVLMFGLLIMIFTFLPGWKAPFSNTIGYLIARLGGVRKIFMTMILESQSGKSKKALRINSGVLPKHGDESHFKRPLIQQIYDNPSLMLNEMTPNNFNTFTEEMYRNRIINKSATKYFSKLYKFVTLKDCVSEYIWYMLVGSFVIVTSYNALSQIPCKKNTSKMLAQHAQWNANENEEKTEPERRVYYTRE